MIYITGLPGALAAQSSMMLTPLINALSAQKVA